MGGVISVQLSAEPLIACFWAGCTGGARYIRNLRDNLEKLRDLREQLRSLKYDVLSRLQDEERLGMRPLEQVRGWLYKADDAIAKIDDLLRDAGQEVDKLCLGGCCSKDCKSSYKYGKHVVEILEHAADLKAKGNFEMVATKLISVPSISRSREPSVGLENVLGKVCSFLAEETVGIVGLCGMGGVGKTTLLIQINNAFFNSFLSFDVVIWVDAPSDLKLEEIQAQIGEKLGFTDQRWRRKSSSDKAADIFSALAKMKFLLLLDDLWGRVDLAEVGVPLPEAQDKGSKIVFTTRSEIVCKQMDAQTMIRLEPLAEEAAWALFKNAVGEETLNCQPDFSFLARAIAKECCGLPLALITVGRAMSSKNTREAWTNALEALRKDASDLTGDEVFHLLKFGYHNLPNRKIQSCFLYCTLFPGGFRISKADLIDYWICEGFWNEGIEVSSRDEAYEIIESLVHAYLLEDGGNYVKMHDMIRDMAISLAGRDFLVKAGAKLLEAPEVEKWKEARRISLMKNSIENLAEAPSCPKLLTLFLCCNPHLFKIADTFFQSMDELTVLDLSQTSLQKLPLGISRLVSLQYLNLSQTFIEELPLEFEKLEKLKYLNLEHTDCLAIIRRDLIARLSLLQVLKMFCCGIIYGKEDNNVLSDGNVLLRELYELQHLKELTITIRRSASPLQNFLSAGNNLPNSVQALSLEHLSGSKSLNVSLFVDMKHLKTLQISHNNDLEELIVESVGEGPETKAPDALYELATLRGRYFESLREVNVIACSRIRELTWLIILAPNLVVLSVRICQALEAILSAKKLGEALELEASENQNPFSKLEVLTLENLPQLTSIYRKTLSFPHLKRIQVINCPNLARLPLTSDTAEGSNFVIEAEESWWGLVQWENEATRKAFQPCFVPYASDVIDPWD